MDPILQQLQSLADGVVGPNGPSEGTITITKDQALYLKDRKVRLKSAEETNTGGYRVACGELYEVLQSLKDRELRKATKRQTEDDPPSE